MNQRYRITACETNGNIVHIAPVDRDAQDNSEWQLGEEVVILRVEDYQTLRTDCDHG